jgi:hypothetical protein
MSTPIDTAKDFTDDDIQGMARRVANNAIRSAEASDRAAVYAGHLFRDHIYNEALLILRSVALHERQRADRETTALLPTHYNVIQR